MSHLNTKNLRGKKLNKIMTGIAMFIVSETYQDELDAQKMLSDAIALIEKAQDVLIKADEAEAAKS